MQREFDHQLREHVGDPLMYAPSQKLSVISEGKVLFRWSCGEDFEFFDLASLTKILFSAPLWVRLLQHSSLDVKDEARVYLPWWKNGDGVTVEQLLIHSSGLTWWKPFFKKIKEGSLQKRREQLIELLKKEVPENPGQVCMYSDLSLFYLGLIAEEVFQKSLMDLWLETKAQMGYESLHFQKANQLSHKKSSYAPTGFSEWREKELQGEVHDDNAWSFGGVAPHAGLFGGLEDLENYLLSMRKLSLGDPACALKPDFAQRFFQRKTPKSLGDFGYLFMKPTKGASSAGRFFDDSSFGHTGFTGTSIWYSPKKDLGVILLTNRVQLGVDLPHFKVYRPLVHDLVGQIVLGSEWGER